MLPSLDVDYRSVCRHAAGIFRSNGHRRLALIVPSSGVAGDLASEQGFREGAVLRPNADPAEAIIVRHDGTVRHLTAKLDELFGLSRAPTALLVAKPQHMFLVIVYLLKRGLAVPETVSLIARDQDHLFENTVSHYMLGGETVAHRLSRLMLQMVGQGYLPTEPNLIFPRYVSAGTVKRLTR
jgi:DNA-binding LacI/PurR family transcriptional regulator